MIDFAEWCQQKGLATIHDDGTITWNETHACHKDPVKAGKQAKYDNKLSGSVRDQRKDLSKDFKNFSAHNGTVWPFKLAKGGTAVAD